MPFAAGPRLSHMHENDCGLATCRGDYEMDPEWIHTTPGSSQKSQLVPSCTGPARPELIPRHIRCSRTWKTYLDSASASSSREPESFRCPCLPNPRIDVVDGLEVHLAFKGSYIESYDGGICTTLWLTFGLQQHKQIGHNIHVHVLVLHRRCWVGG